MGAAQSVLENGRRRGPRGAARVHRDRSNALAVHARRTDVIARQPRHVTVDQAFLDRPGNAEIQLDLFYDYRNNLPLYAAWQEYFRERRPPTLVVWGRNDEIFVAAGAAPYKRDNPRAEIHLLDAGHFALETHGPEIAALMRDFLGRALAR